MQNSFKDKGIEYIKRALDEDKKSNFEEAFKMYTTGLDYFRLHIKYEKNERIKETIEEKMREYIDRAEQLQKYIANKSQEECSNGENKSGSTASAQKPKKRGGEDANEEKERLSNQLGGAILTEKPNIKWSDVAGLDAAKDALKEAVILPVKFPQFFTGKRKPWKGFLLYGPPGTGKSFLAKAVATEADSTFITVSSSDLVSKWMGESEKLVAQLFDMARQKAPSIIFIDEIDSLCSSRGEGESEAARRIKTEFLVQMQGVGNNTDKVLVLAATNLPYQIDQALRRRFDKRIYIPLPEAPARATMFKLNLGDTPHNLTDQCFRDLASQTEGFSGSDISVVVKDVLMEPLRRTQEATHFRREQREDGVKFVPCGPAEYGAQEVSLYELAEQGNAENVIVPEITIRDFQNALSHSRPTVSKEDLKVYEDFTEEFGQEG